MPNYPTLDRFIRRSLKLDHFRCAGNNLLHTRPNAKDRAFTRREKWHEINKDKSDPTDLFVSLLDRTGHNNKNPLKSNTAFMLMDEAYVGFANHIKAQKPIQECEEAIELRQHFTGYHEQKNPWLQDRMRNVELAQKEKGFQNFLDRLAAEKHAEHVGKQSNEHSFPSLYYRIIDDINFSIDFKNHIKNGAQTWLDKQKQPEGWKNFSITEQSAYALKMLRDLQNVLDPTRKIHDLSDIFYSRDPSYQEGAIHMIEGYHPLRTDSPMTDFLHAFTFCGKVMNNRGTHDNALDHVYLHCHAIEFDPEVKAWAEPPENGPEEEVTDVKTSKIVFHRDMPTICREHAINGKHYMVSNEFDDFFEFTQVVLHEGIHQFHFRCREAFRFKPSIVTQLTGYDHADNLLTYASNHVYDQDDDDKYEANKIETLVQDTLHSMTKKSWAALTDDDPKNIRSQPPQPILEKMATFHSSKFLNSRKPKALKL